MIRRWLLSIAAALAMAGSIAAVAQVPNAEQLELLRSLSPEDRQALMEQLGIENSGTRQDNPDASQAADGTRRTLPRTDAGTRVDPAKLAEERALKPNDSLLFDLEFKKEQPARIESAGPNLPPLTIPAVPPPTLEPIEKENLERIIEMIRAKNPYQLDVDGSLQLPGFAPIMLAGLDEQQATKRLAAIDVFRKLDVKLTRLPVRKQGVAGLKPFGYDLFTESPANFAPLTDVPVPSDYVVGAGDQLNIQLYGSQNRTLKLTVARDGRISFPGIGPIEVAGRTFSSASADVEARVQRQMIGVRASVSMGQPRSIHVFVMGEANRPGSYTVSGLATITSALYASGGVKPIGSLRDIQLKRQGAVVRRLDLYDLLLRGDTSDDAKLLPGDVIFIPPAAATVAIEGEVQRPAIYELRGENTVSEAVALAGGLTSEADSSRVALVRVNKERARVVLDVPLDGAGGASEILQRGDNLRVLRLRPTLDSGVAVEGHVFRPGLFAWHEGMRLTDVIGSVDELRPNADLNYVLVRRELAPDRRVAYVSADFAKALLDPQSAANVPLMARDRVLVFDGESGRTQILAPLVLELRRQGSQTKPGEVVRVDGRVKAAGDYPLEANMRVLDLVRAGGGLQDAAYGMKAELTRYRISGDTRQTELIEVDLGAVMRGDASANIILWPSDILNVQEVAEWASQDKITLDGEVRFPGTYPLRTGESLRSVLARAGGLTAEAFPSGAVFTRSELREREQIQLDRLADRLQGDLAVAALQGVQANQGQSGDALAVGQSLLSQLKSSKAVGRLVIDLAAITSSTEVSTDVVLRGGDRLFIPKTKQEVTVIGEVQSATSHLYRDNLTRDDYIGKSGGLTRKADRGRIYIVRADGSVVSGENLGWFRRSAQVSMKPGDTIVAPLDTERLPPLPLWQSVTQIVYNLAIAAAAVNSF